MTKGNYTVKISENADGTFYALMVYCGHQCVPGIPGRNYATKAAAERGAKIMLSKV